MMPVRTLRQLLGLDRDTEYVTVPAQVTALVIAVAFAAYIAVTRIADAPAAVGVLVIAAVVAVGLLLATRGSRGER